MKAVIFALLTGCADLHLLDMLTPMERKRQGYIHELIVTEENYVNDLQLVTEVRSCNLFMDLMQNVVTMTPRVGFAGPD